MVGAVGQELQHEVRERRASLAQVDLDRVGATDPVLDDADEVDAVAPYRTVVAQDLADASTGVVQLGSVHGVGGEAAPEEDLPRGATQDLVVGRDDLDLAERIDPALHGR